LSFSCRQEYGPPSQWPILYLYPEPPPNETSYFTPNSNYQEPNSYDDDSPQIQFRPNNPHVYPKAIVQKLDLKDAEPPKSSNGDSIQLINPRKNFGKKIKEPEYVLKYSGSSPNSSFMNDVRGSTLTEFSYGKPYLNDTVTPNKINKTKAILDQIEKIIENNTKNCNETAEKIEKEPKNGIVQTKGFEKSFRETESAMDKFWNWGQDNYFLKDTKSL